MHIIYYPLKLSILFDPGTYLNKGLKYCGHNSKKKII